jgi:hypothetical protein
MRAIYKPTGQHVNITRQLKDEGVTYFIVTPLEDAPNGYRPTYQATANQLIMDVPNGHPQSEGPKTGLVLPFAPNSLPEQPNVPRLEEPPSGIDPSRLIWINDPNLTEDFIVKRIVGLGVITARGILDARAAQPDGVFSSIDDIPLRIDSHKQYFSLVRVFPDQEQVV